MCVLNEHFSEVSDIVIARYEYLESVYEKHTAEQRREYKNILKIFRDNTNDF